MLMTFGSRSCLLKLNRFPLASIHCKLKKYCLLEKNNEVVCISTFTWHFWQSSKVIYIIVLKERIWAILCSLSDFTVAKLCVKPASSRNYGHSFNTVQTLRPFSFGHQIASYVVILKDENGMQIL